MRLIARISNIPGAAKGIGGEIIKMSTRAADVSSFCRFTADLFLLRAFRHSKRERRIRLKGGVRLTYRLNRGDMQSIREVWLGDAYKLPFQPTSEVLVDLGANIGTAGLWLAKRYGYSTVIAVEPSPDNARLARINFEENGVDAQVIEAAVGPEDGVAFFDDAEASNLGRVNSKGRPVLMLSMQSVLSRLPPESIVDLVKMDIEGGEEPLLKGDLNWLRRVRHIVAEFHPDLIDYPRAISTLRNAEFKYIAAGTAHKDSMDAFVSGSLVNRR